MGCGPSAPSAAEQAVDEIEARERAMSESTIGVEVVVLTDEDALKAAQKTARDATAEVNRLKVRLARGQGDHLKENAALKEGLATRDTNIAALKKEVTTLKKENKKIPALEKENTALKKEIKKMKGGGSSGTFTTSTGLSDQQLLAIAMGDGDKDKTVVAKSVQE
eukprot:gene18388-4531_t